jgi:copper transport protein
VLVLLAAAPALASRGAVRLHATLLSSEPAAGSSLVAAPTRVRLVFSEPIEGALGRISLVAGDGRTTPLTAAGDPRDVHALVAPVRELAPGAYRVVWRIVSADGHPVDGSFVFTIGPASERAPPAVAAPPLAPAAAGWGPAIGGAPLVPAALRGLGVGTLMALAGLLGFLARPSHRDAKGPIRPAVWLGGAAAVLLLLHLAAWVVNAAPEHRFGGGQAEAALASRVGRVELARTALAVLAFWALALARRVRLALAFAVGALVVSGATGHAAAIHPAWTAPAKALHLLAASGWLGGLLWLLWLLWLLARERTDVATFAREAGRVSAVALGAVFVVAVSGVVQALLILPSPLDLFRSVYGAVTLAKVAGLAVLLLFGAYHRNRVLPRLAEAGSVHGFAASLRREVAVMSLVVLLGGLLAYLSPPAPPGGSTPPWRPFAQ